MQSPQLIQQSIDSLKSQGFSDELIALYLQQMEQSTQVYVGHLPPNSSLYQTVRNPAAVGPLLVNPASELTQEQQWAIACGADVSFGNGYYLNDLTTGLSRLECRKGLGEQYDIDSTEEVEESLEWLVAEGHRKLFDSLWQLVNLMSIKEVKEYLRNHVVNDERDEAIMLQRLRNFRDTQEAFKRHGLMDERFKPDMLIWDYGRIISLCRGCYDAGYISREMAMEHIMRSAEVIGKTYDSWRQLSLSFQFARFIWKGFDEGYFMQGLAAMEVLLNKAGSPWVVLQWKKNN